MKRLFIDLDKCDRCPDACPVKCSYYYHPFNDGVCRLRELAGYLVVCRRCEVGSCVQACPVEALERGQDGVLRRYSMRCVSCKSCSLACPFGTILPELLPFTVSTCDFCVDRCQDKDPLCVRTCPYGAIQFCEIEPNEEKAFYGIGEHLVIRSTLHWERNEAKK
ncbi:MAG: 4Fe-4S ferredoxin [Candidatus Omnitrophica bacterium]|nr:4Fe-4S ferredoxin [Candidatus Omnitrophota bacterium]